MNAEQLDQLKYYFCFRQISGGSAGRWVVVGPFDTSDQALAERQRSKAVDAEVSMYFVASSKAEAQAKCDSGRGF